MLARRQAHRAQTHLSRRFIGRLPLLRRDLICGAVSSSPLLLLSALALPGLLHGFLKALQMQFICDAKALLQLELQLLLLLRTGKRGAKDS